MPWEMNVTMEEEKVEVEQLRDALIQAVAGYAQALPAMAAQGQDPSKILTAMATIINGRQEGKQIEETVGEAFAPAEPTETGPEQPAAQEAQPGQPGAGGQEGQLPQGLEASGRMQGVAPGQQGMAPGGRPALQTLLTGLSSSGNAQMSAGTIRRQPI